MKRYKILKYFRWGVLPLNKNQIVIVEDKGNNSSTVRVEHIPGKTQVISTKAVESMLMLKKIELY